jgi:multiple sugar transport system permease protein
MFGIFYIFPFIWMILTALKPNDQIFVYPPKLFPSPFKWGNFVEAINTIPFFRYTLNSVIVATLATVGTLISCPLAAYSMSRLKWKGSNTLFVFTLAVMMIPSQVTMVPLFIIFSKMNLVGGFTPLILPMFFGVPYYIFLMKQFFMQLPKSLEDAARIDGCSEFQVYLRIMLPLCQPSLLAIGMFQFVAAWNDFLGPLIYLNSEKMYTLQIGLQQFKQSNSVQWSLLMAAAVLVALPIILMYFIAQKRFVEGITFGGVKG